MSDTPEYDLLAAEYVIGLLEPQEARVVRSAAERDPAMRSAIAVWQARLAPISLAVPEVTPPRHVWPRIEASIDGGATESLAAPPSPAPLPPPPPLPPSRPRAAVDARRGRRRWQLATVASLVLAASIAAFAILREPEVQVTPADVAVLAQMDGAKPTYLAVQYSDGSVSLRPLTQVSIPTGRDLELWILPQGAKAPTSFGVLPAGGKRFTPAQPPPPQAQLLVSLEQTGGSPTGKPQGPILYGGTLTALN
jgi:anti-sigma-K factor RskA